MKESPKTQYDKPEEELRSMSDLELDSRLRDVSETLAKLRKMGRAGLGNPKVQNALKREKRIIRRIQEDRGLGKS